MRVTKPREIGGGDTMTAADDGVGDAPAAFARGMTFGEYLAGVRVHRQAFRDHYERLAGIVDELRAAPPLANVRTLAIVEDWCPDCVFNVPILARLAEASQPDSLRVVRRPECRSLADTFPGRGGVSRVPTFVFLNDADDVLGHWSERCAASQGWFDTFTKDHPLPELNIHDGIPVPRLLDWMNLRIAAERGRFYQGVWRDVCAEVGAVLGKSGRKAAPF